MKKVGWVLSGIAAMALGAGTQARPAQPAQATQQATQAQGSQQTNSGTQAAEGQAAAQQAQSGAQTAPGQAPAAPAAQATGVPAGDWQARAREVVENLVAGKFAAVEATYDEDMKVAMPAGELANTWKTIAEQIGTYQKIADVQVDSFDGYPRVIVTCQFTKSDLWVRTIFGLDGTLAGLRLAPVEREVPWSAPPYADTKAFHEQALTVVNGKFELPGTLTLPTGSGPFPAVVLVQGSGPHDEDESIGPNKPFKDLAWGLASHGVAVLRYVKRTKQYGAASSANPDTFTVDDETVSDARAAVALVAKQTGVDPKRVYVLGHSLGGMMAPRIATGDAQVAGIIILAGTTRPLEDVILDQLHYIKALPGGDTARMYQQMKQAEAAKAQIEDPALKAGTMVDVMGTKIPASYWLDLRNYQPAEAAAKLTIPILVLQGGRDYQVTKPDYEKFQKALAGHTNATLKWYPTMNHLFIEGSKPSAPQEYGILGHVSEQVVNDIVSWAMAQGKS